MTRVLPNSILAVVPSDSQLVTTLIVCPCAIPLFGSHLAGARFMYGQGGTMAANASIEPPRPNHNVF